MSRYIHIHNWNKHQHHKNRHVPWIKDYGAQLSDDDWRDLTFHQRGLLESLRLEYLRTGGRGIRDTTATLTRRLGQRVLTRDIEALNHAGFIELSSRQTLDGVYARIEQRREDPPLTPPKAKPKTKKESKPRQADPLWDEMVLAFEVRGFTPSSRGAMNKAVSELRSAHAVPSDIRERKAVYERKYPDAACTPSALAKHWPYLGGTVGDDSERQRNADLFARLNGGSS